MREERKEFEAGYAAGVVGLDPWLPWPGNGRQLARCRDGMWFFTYASYVHTLCRARSIEGTWNQFRGSGFSDDDDPKKQVNKEPFEGWAVLDNWRCAVEELRDKPLVPREKTRDRRLHQTIDLLILNSAA